jgi:hypothetical protein
MRGQGAARLRILVGLGLSARRLLTGVSGAFFGCAQLEAIPDHLIAFTVFLADLLARA